MSLACRGTVALLGVLVLALTAGCSRGKKVEESFEFTPDEMYIRALELLEKGKTTQAVEVFESFDFRYAGADRAVLEPLVRIGIADATFYKGSTLDLIEARSLYLDFVTLYGDHPMAPYAQFQAGVCSLEQSSHPAKDQSQTRAAFGDLRQVERRYPASRFASAADDMIQKAEDGLAEHDYLVGHFYMKRKKFVAASERFRNLLRKYPNYAETEKIYYWLGRALLRLDNDVEGRLYLDKLVTDYPNSRYSEQARRALSELSERMELDLGPSSDLR